MESQFKIPCFLPSPVNGYEYIDIIKYGKHLREREIKSIFYNLERDILSLPDDEYEGSIIYEGTIIVDCPALIRVLRAYTKAKKRYVNEHYYLGAEFVICNKTKPDKLSLLAAKSILLDQCSKK